MAYFGPPGEAREHFGTDHYPEIFTRLEEEPLGRAKHAYATSAKARIYLEEPLRRQLQSAPPPVARPPRATNPAPACRARPGSWPR